MYVLDMCVEKMEEEKIEEEEEAVIVTTRNIYGTFVHMYVLSLVSYECGCAEPLDDACS